MEKLKHYSGDFEVKVSKVWKCLVCNKEITEYIEEYCCDGRYCGCGGMPIDPPVCSQECWNKGIQRSRNEERT